MSEEAKKHNIGGGASLMAKSLSEDRKPLAPSPLSASASPLPPAPKKVIIKSADMLPDMQKEAVDIAVVVSLF
jgi:dynein light chain LC8-type